MKNTLPLLLCIFLVGIGALSGWYAANQSSTSHEDEGEDHAPVPTSLSQASLNNLGVEIGQAKLSAFTKYKSIPASIARISIKEQPVFTPMGGRITELLVQPGMTVKAGQHLATLLRDPIPRPTLTLTESILKPAQESLHSALVQLRASLQELQIVELELERVQKYTQNLKEGELPVLPRQREIDLKYQLLRVKKDYEQAQVEFTKHGLSEEEIVELAGGKSLPPITNEHWKSALKVNGLWPAQAEKLAQALPKSIVSLPWAIATIGELSASGLIQPELIAWIESIPGDCEHFLEIGALLQQGHSVADLKSLHKLHAFDAEVKIMAPQSSAEWNIDEIDTRVGARAEAGAMLMQLFDPRSMYIQATPIGAEKAILLEALRTKQQCEAIPLVKGTGPILKNIVFSFISELLADEMHSDHFLAEVPNQIHSENENSSGLSKRSWKLREGMQYILRAPQDSFPKAYVLPSEAVANDGPRKIVFIKSGENFKAVEVELLYQDEEVVVLPADQRSSIFPGDKLVVKGAFALKQALIRGDAVDPHAGHSH